MESNDLDMNFEEFNQFLKLFSLCKSEYFTIKHLMSRISLFKILKKTKQLKNTLPSNATITFQEPISQDLSFFNGVKQVRANLLIMLHKDQVKTFNILRQGTSDISGKQKQGLLQITSEIAHLILTSSSFANSTSINHEWKQKEFEVLLSSIMEKSTIKLRFEEILEIVDSEVFGKNDKKPLLSFSNYITLNLVVKVLLMFSAYIDDLMRIIQIINKDGSGVLQTQSLTNIIMGLTDQNSFQGLKDSNLEFDIFLALGIRIGATSKPCIILREVIEGFLREIARSILIE